MKVLTCLQSSKSKPSSTTISDGSSLECFLAAVSGWPALILVDCDAIMDSGAFSSSKVTGENN